MLSSAFVLLSAAAAAWAMPRQSHALDAAELLESRAITPSTDAICGAFNGSTTCAGSPFGSCCSQFGYCGSSDIHCGTGCQVGYGTCGPPQPKTWTNLGCYTDNTLSRTLNTSVLVAGNTVERCQNACANRGFTHAGVEFGSQCFCGTAVQNSPSLSTQCNKECAGDSREICGGSNAINLYTLVPTWQNLGCYSDSTIARTLDTSLNIAGNTVEKCQAECMAGGFIYAGMEFGSQCFCGNAILNDGAPIAASSCNRPCPGDSAAICGGSNALSLYLVQ